jgi:CHAD domain-containing protein
MENKAESSPDVLEAFADYQADLIKSVISNLRVAGQYCTIDAVHDFRVGIKRWRAFLALAQHIFGNLTDLDTKALKKLYKKMGAVRDVHVQQQLIHKNYKTETPSLSEYLNYLKQTELAAKEKMLKACRRFDYSFFDGIAKSVNERLALHEPNVLIFRTRQFFNSFLDYITTLAGKSELSEDDLHQLRIQAKKARYVLEVLRKCCPDQQLQESLNDKLRAVHRALGLWHDYAVALESLTAFRQEFSASDLGDHAAYDALIDDFWANRENNLENFDQAWSDLSALLRTESMVRPLQK